MTKQFIKVKATPCNPQGNAGHQPRQVELLLNCDLIGAFQSNSVLLKQGEILIIGGNYFKSIILDEKIE